MKIENQKKEILLNFKATNFLFMMIDSLRIEEIKNSDSKKIPSRSEMIRILLNEAIKNRGH